MKPNIFDDLSQCPIASIQVYRDGYRAKTRKGTKFTQQAWLLQGHCSDKRHSYLERNLQLQAPGNSAHKRKN